MKKNIPTSKKAVATNSSECPHGGRRNRCHKCGASSHCVHGKRPNQCKECGGKSICEHGRRKNMCKDCGGSSFCIHKRQKNTCRECKGKSRCVHGRLRQKNTCRECKGKSRCVHGRLRQKNTYRECNDGFKKCTTGSDYTALLPSLIISFPNSREKLPDQDRNYSSSLNDDDDSLSNDLNDDRLYNFPNHRSPSPTMRRRTQEYWKRYTTYFGSVDEIKEFLFSLGYNS